MNKVELVKKVVESKVQEVNRKQVYTGYINEESQWTPTSLYDRYRNIVMVVKAPEGEPVKLIGDFEFMGGNNNRLVYVSKSFVCKWLEVAGGDSHWAGAAVLRPGKLARKSTTIDWSGYQRDEADEGLLAVMSKEDWKALLESFDLDQEVNLVQVTIFDLAGGVSAKGTLRKVLPGERATVYPNAWKKFGSLRTKFMAILTTDAHYNPRASVNLQELQYYAETPAEWIVKALDEEIERILAFKTSTWLSTGYLTKLGFSPAWNTVLGSIKEHLTGELKKLLRRIKLSARYGLRAKSTMSELQEGEIMLPAHAKEYVRAGDTVYVSRNPALPSQGWGRYRVAGFVNGNFVVFAKNDRQWSALLGGDHDGDDAVVWYKPPVKNYEPPKDALDLQAVKPQARKLDANTVEARIQRWKNEKTVNIGQFDLAARRLMAVGKLNRDDAKLISLAIQTAISLKKRIARLEDQPWWPLVNKLLEESKKVASVTWVDMIREGKEPVGAPEWVNKIYKTVQEGIKRVEKLEPRLWLTEAKVKEFAIGATVPASCEWIVRYREHLLNTKTVALLNNDGDTVARINREIKEFVHVGVPSWLTEIDEADWMEFSKWAIANVHSSEWVFWCHPEVLEQLYQTFGKKVHVAITTGEHTLQEGDIFEVDEEEALKREFEIDGKTYTLLEDTGFIKASVQYQVIKVRKRVVEFVEV